MDLQQRKTVPIAQLLRKRKRADQSSISILVDSYKISKLDEAISNLEKNENDNLFESGTRADELVVEEDDDGNMTRVYSRIQEEDRIDPLPSRLLPNAVTVPKPRKVNTTSRSNSMQEIKKAIESYVPNSQVKRPFYCRFCALQSLDLPDYQHHLQTSSHQEKERFYKKISFCHLCRKQFTSPEQLKEHKSGRAHQERLSQRQINPPASRSHFERY